MSANAPWSIKGIDAKAREVAKALAHQAGMTLGEWLNQMILEGRDVPSAIDEAQRQQQAAPIAQQAHASSHSQGPAQGYSQAPASYPQQTNAAAGQMPNVPAYAPPYQAPHPNYAPQGQAFQPVYQAPLAHFPHPQAVSYDSLAQAHLNKPQNTQRFSPSSRHAPEHHAHEDFDDYLDDQSFHDVSQDALRRPRPAAFSPQSRKSRAPMSEQKMSSQDLGAQELGTRGDISRVAHVLDALTDRIEASEKRSSHAVRGVSSAVEQILSRLEGTESLASQFDEKSEEISQARLRLERTEEDQGAIAHRLHEAERLLDAQAERLEGLSGHLREERERVVQLEQKLESVPMRETLGTIEATLGKLANQIYENDARTRETMRELREDLTTSVHRLGQIEQNDPERVAQNVVDRVMSRLNERLESTEHRAATAMRAFEQALSRLDARISHAELGGDVADPHALVSLRHISDDFNRRLEQTRQDLLGLITTTAKAVAPDDAMIGARLHESEQRQNRRIEQLGQDVIRAAKSLTEETDKRAHRALEHLNDQMGRRLSHIETNASEAQSRLSADIAKLSDKIDTPAQASPALDRLGAEVARISERLNARLSEADRKLNDSLNEAGKNFQQSHDVVRQEILERIKQSEERTQQRLEEARKKIEQQLSKTQTEALLTQAVLKSASERVSEKEGDLGEAHGFSRNLGPSVNEVRKPEPHTFDAAPIDLSARLLGDFDRLRAEPVHKKPVDLSEMDRPLRPVLGQMAAHEAEEDEDPFALVPTARKATPLAAKKPEPSSQSILDDDMFDDDDEDVFEPSVQKNRAEPVDELLVEDEEVSSAVSLSTREALAAARAAVRASLEGTDEEMAHSQLRMKRPKSAEEEVKPASPAAKNAKLIASQAVKASGIAALLVVGGVSGYLAFQDEITGAISGKPKDTVERALIIQDMSQSQAPNPVSEDLHADYAEVIKSLEARAPDAVEKLKVVANKGHVQAQFRLGKIYEGFEKRVTPDKAEARAWYLKAAEGGEREAMYNLALLYHHGEGGEQDRTRAVVWFRKAAERGVVDAQFNLGALYQSGGEGVPINPSEAYRWFKIAAKSGDKEADRVAEEAASRLNEAQRAKIDAEIANFVPVTDTATLISRGSSLG